MQKFFKEKWNIIATLIIIGAFWGGIQVGAKNISSVDQVPLSSKETPSEVEADFSSFWKAWNIIDKKYPADKASSQERVYGAISGLMESLEDPYSVFFDPDETKAFEDEISGNFSGVGMEVGIRNKVLTVIAPLKGTPAYKANIEPGDIILKIDETATSDLKLEEAIKLIKGEKGTTVTLTILHEGDTEPIEVKIVRDIINIPTLDTELRSDGIFVIKLYSFSSNSANLFRNAIKEFKESESNKLILDLRGNPGGYLDAAVNISSWFLPSGEVVVTEDYGNNQKPEIFRSKGYNVFSDKVEVIVLIDGGSASASEIVAGALQDYDKAQIVGSQSFGKGSVQEVVKVTPDTLLKITVAKWLTPKGNLIDGKGLTPDYKIEITKKDVEEKKDPQMDKAISLLLD